VSEALQLFDVPATPRLTDRQQCALDAICAAGWEGLHTDELGALAHGHGPEQRCQWCGSAGQELGKALRAKGLVRQRRRKAPNGDTVTVWTVAGRLPAPEAVRDNGSFNVFPEGY
jgi:hypothetical protein